MVLSATSKPVSGKKIPDGDVVEIIAEEDEHAPIIGSVFGTFIYRFYIMGGVRQVLRQLCLLSLFSTLYLNVGAHKETRPEQEVLAPSRIIDHHLMQDRPSVKTTKPADFFVDYIKGFMTDVLEVIDEQVAYSNQRFVYGNKRMSLESTWNLPSGSSSPDSIKVASSTPVYGKDQHKSTVSSDVTDGNSTTNTTKPSTSGQLIDDFKALLRTLIQDVDRRVARKKNLLNATTEVVTEKSLDDSSSTVASSVTPVYSSTASTNESRTSTADAYTRSSSTTTTGKTSTGGSQQPTQDVHSTTPVPPFSAIPLQPSPVGSINSIPGIHYPNYTDIPITSFTCADKAYLPGFYADLETGCQVFHVCWRHRRESFLCPLGTTFNQALLACDYWYSTNCSLAPHYYDVNDETSQSMSTIDTSSKSMVDALLEKSKLSLDASTKSNLKLDEVLSIISKFLPVKAKVVIYPEADGKRAKIVASTSVGKQEVVHAEEEQKLLHVKTSTSKPEFVSTTEGKVIQKPDHIKVEQKVTDPEVSVRDLRNEAVRTASKIFMMKLAEKLGFSMATPSNIGAVNDDFKAFELAVEKLFSSISEMKRKFEKGQSGQVQAIKPVEPTLKPVVKEPQIAQKPRGLTQLNPRFIIKPVSLTKVKLVTGSEKPVVPVTYAPKPVFGTKKPTVVHPLPQPIVGTKKPTVVHPVMKPHPYSRLNINPETKAVLINNYLRYLKIKKLA